MKRLRGSGVSPGVALGAAYRFARAEIAIPARASRPPDAEWLRLLDALEAADAQLAALRDAAARQVGADNAAIFDAQREFLRDPELRDAAQQAILQARASAEAAIARATQTYEDLLLATDNPYLQERAADLRDVRARILRILQPQNGAPKPLNAPSVVVADDLTPSDAIQLERRYILALCMAGGGATSHTAILARSLGVPAVVGAGIEILSVTDGEMVALDGATGEVVLAPDTAEQAAFRERQARFQTQQIAFSRDAHAPAVTLDGHRIVIAANVSRPDDAQDGLDNGAEGVGLLRTEFLYAERLPDEDRQYAIYRDIAGRMRPHPVIIRALDIGGDKPLPYLPMSPEANPFLGSRAIRLLLANPDLLRTQLRAALRANADTGNIRFMLPMVTDVSEIHAARALLDEIRQALELGSAGLSLGMMVETPAAALMVEHFAPLLDFFSIGSNDLTQYTLAVDRGNPQVGYLYDSLHPAVLRLMKQTADAAHTAGRWVGVCGELAGQPEAAPLLVGLGMDELSMSPRAIPAVKAAVRAVRYADAQALAAAALAQPDAASVRRQLQNAPTNKDMGG